MLSYFQLRIAFDAPKKEYAIHVLTEEILTLTQRGYYAFFIGQWFNKRGTKVVQKVVGLKTKGKDFFLFYF